MTNSRESTSATIRWFFGDRLGLLLFLTTMCGLAVFWRAGTFITDTNTIVRTLEAVAAGSVKIDIVSGDHFTAPGAVVSDGAVYGRNYGQVVLAVPLLWGIEILAVLSNLRVGLLVGWHLLGLALVRTLRLLIGGSRRITSIASGCIVVSMAANLAVLTSFSDVSRPLLALQLLGLIAAGWLAVGIYRLIRLYHSGRVATAAGLAGALVLPVGFWAQLPKRHVLISMLVVWLLYAFARSRMVDAGTATGRDRSALYRAGAYAIVGLMAWIHAAEAIFVLLALVAIDLPTAPSNDGRTLGMIGVAFGLALLPFLLTNTLISGDPLAPPRTLTPASAVESPTSVLEGGPEPTGGTGGGLNLPGQAIVTEFVWLASVIIAQIGGSLAALDTPGIVFRTWIRSGSLEQYVGGGLPEYRSVNLAVFEVAPVLVGVVVSVATSVCSHPLHALRRIKAVDALAVGIAVAYVLLYTQRLPLHVQITVRYLLPIYPIGLILLVRQRSIRRLITERTNIVGWSSAATVLIGSQMLLVTVLLTGRTVGEAAQLHAVVGLAAAGTLGVAMLATRFEQRLQPITAVSLGAAAGLGTAFILLSGLVYFSFIGPFVLPVSEAIAEAIGPI
ncbi:MAG: hypothetical protein ABEH64_06135 [Salinirussus sp.]